MPRGASSALGVVLAALLAVGCRGGSLGPVDPPAPRAVEDYRLLRSQGGVTVAVDPVLDEKTSKQLFVLDLPKVGVVPIYMVIRNTSGHTLLVQKNDIRLEVGGRSEGHSRADVPSAPGRAAREKASGALGTLFIAEQVAFTAAAIATATPAGVIVDLPLFIAALALTIPEEHRRQANERLMYYELPDRSLASGKTEYGFVYMRVDRATFQQPGATLRVRATAMDGGDDANVDLAFDLSGADPRPTTVVPRAQVPE